MSPRYLPVMIPVPFGQFLPAVDRVDETGRRSCIWEGTDAWTVDIAQRIARDQARFLAGAHSDGICELEEQYAVEAHAITTATPRASLMSDPSNTIAFNLLRHALARAIRIAGPSAAMNALGQALASVCVQSPAVANISNSDQGWSLTFYSGPQAGLVANSAQCAIAALTETEGAS